MKAALYARVSTEEQAERYGLSSQLTELRALAARKGYEVVGEFTDEGISGATLDRPQLERLRELVRHRAVDVVLTHDLDRLTRDVGHCALLLEEFERADVRLEFIAMTAERTAEGRLLLDVKAALGSYERAKIRERTRRGRLEKARQGKWPRGRPAYGYRVLESRLVIDPAPAAVVRRIFAWYVEGWSLRRIVLALRAEGASPPTPTARQWEKASVWRILQQTGYVGRVIWNRRVSSDRKTVRPAADWIEIPAPRLVSDATFARVQALLQANRGRLAGRPPVDPSALRGLLWCGACGRRLYLTINRRRRWVGRYFRCAGKDRTQSRTGVACGTALLRAEPIEAAVWDTVVGLLRQPEALLGPAFEVAQRRLGVRDVEVRSEVAHLQRQREAVTRRIAATATLVGDPDMPHPELRDRLGDLEAHRRALGERLKAARARLRATDAQETQTAGVRRFCETFGARLEELGQTVEGRRTVFTRCLDRVVWRAGQLEIDAVLPAEMVSPSEIAELA